MGATNCPETPRQRMIGMMYLVLTAMLALNVSVEIINAFVTVGDSMEATNKNFSKKIESTYIQFHHAYEADKEKVGEKWAEAQKVRSLTKEMIAYIENVKSELVARTEDISKDEATKLLEESGAQGISKKDNFDIPTNYFIGQSNDGSAGEARKLKNELEKYRKSLINVVGEGGKHLKLGLETDGKYYNADGEELNWEMKHFYHTVCVADLVILNKYKAEVLNAELDVVNFLYSSVSAGDFKFDNVRARVVPKSTYILQGGAYEAEIFVAAYDSKSKLEAEIAGHKYVGDTGVINYKSVGSGIGQQRYSGMIYVKKETGTEAYPFSGDYFVAPPAVVISPTNMNVFYVGVENPVDIAVPGASAESITPQVLGGQATITKASAGKYIVTARQPALVKIEVFADFAGQKRSMGVKEYRCKRIPPAQPIVGRVQGTNGSISREELLAADRIMVRIPDFEFPVKLTVKSFQFRTTSPEGKVVRYDNAGGGTFTSDMRTAIQSLRRGNRVNLEDILIQKPDGSTESLSMSLKIQ